MQQQAPVFPIVSHVPHIVYTPEPFLDENGWLHLVLGYPKCPLIGRYNKGDYQIGDIVKHLEFKLNFNEDIHGYQCGLHAVAVPEFLTGILRNIPEVIPYNKPKNIKSEPDVHLTHHLPQATVSLNWIVSMGPMGKDFLNYINHTYVFEEEVFFGEKLKRTTDNIPILAYMPEHSGLYNEEVERGICMSHLRSEYLSLHLKGGAPAFSPNNMRVGVEGMKKVVTKPKAQKQKKGEKGKNKKKEENEQQMKKQPPVIDLEESEIQKEQIIEADKEQQPRKQEQVGGLEEEDDLFGELNLEQLEEQAKADIHHKQQAKKKEKGIPKHQGFLHFYTVVLLEGDHRINYHWHIEDHNKQDLVTQLLSSGGNVREFVEQYRSVVDEDALIKQLGNLLMM